MRIADCRFHWRLTICVLGALTFGAAACGSPASPTATGLAGTVLRGPVQPVCTAGSACEAPFSAGFALRRGTELVAAFRSDGSGRFEVRASPGSYVVVPDPDAPILFPNSQTKPVEVGSTGITVVELHFDTGIR